MKKHILIRIDDVCPTMDYSKFMERIDYFRTLGIKPLLGVVPDCEDDTLQYGEIENFWEMIRGFAKEGYPIAMHGYKHVYTTQKRGLVCFRKMSEFSGLSYERQLEMLQEGKCILEDNGIHTQWFMAPGHSYDKNTVRALYEAGFRYVSDGRSSRPYRLYGIKFIPASSIWKSPFCGKVVTLCLHPNTDTERSFQKVKTFTQKNKSQISSFSEAEQWKHTAYAVGRIDEIVRMLSEKATLFVYTKLKGLLK